MVNYPFVQFHVIATSLWDRIAQIGDFSLANSWGWPTPSASKSKCLIMIRPSFSERFQWAHNHSSEKLGKADAGSR